MDWKIWDRKYRRAQMEKWSNKLDLRITTDSEIQEYTSAKLYEYMECNCGSYGISYNTWLFFYEDFHYFTTENFNRLGQYHLKELRSQLKETYRPSTDKDVDFDRFMARFEALPITKALSIEALPVDTDTNESAIPVDIDERNQLAVPSANATEPSISTLETNEPVDTDEPAILFANTIEPSVEDALTFNTLTLPPSPLRSIPATGFGQLHILQYTNSSTIPTFAEFGRFQALQRTEVG
jgi:hypothetical protein